MPPTTEKIAIYIAGRQVTKKIDNKQIITITEERGKRIGSGSFTLKDGGSLNIKLWQIVLILSPDFTTNYLWGYIADFKEKKRGVVLDYDIRVSSAETRFNKAIVTGTFTGTDAFILGEILANAVPDLSGLFDFSSGVTALSSDSMTFVANEDTALDAIDNLAEEVGANWGWTMDQSSRINQAYNPALNTDMDSFGSALSANSIWWTEDGQGISDTVYQDEWNEANTVWDAAAGDNGGGIEVTSQTFTIFNGDIEAGFFRLGRATDAADHTMFYERAEAGSDTKLAFTWREQSTEGFRVSMALITYDEAGALYFSQGLTGGSEDTHNYGNQPNYDNGGFGGYDLTDSTIFAESGTFEFQFFVFKNIGTGVPFVANFDEFIVEFVDGAPLVPPVYFDGGSTDAQWMGTTNASPSILLGNKHRLDWAADPEDAPFDLDIGTTDFTGDIEFNFAGLDGINHMIVIGGFGYVDVLWEFHANNSNVIFDLPEELFPADGDTVIIVEKNTNTDGSPVWVGQTVHERIGGELGVGNDLLWSQEEYNLEWDVAPPNLARAFRVTARRKERIRATVTADTNIAATGVELADTLYDENITTLADAHAAGFAALEKRADALQVTFTTYTPGLAPNQEIDIADSSRPFGTQTVTIERVSRTYLGGGFAKFTVAAGQRQDNLADIAVRTRKLAEQKPPLDSNSDGQTLDTILDSNDEPILDGNNQPIFQVTP